MNGNTTNEARVEEQLQPSVSQGSFESSVRNIVSTELSDLRDTHPYRGCRSRISIAVVVVVEFKVYWYRVNFSTTT